MTGSESKVLQYDSVDRPKLDADHQAAVNKLAAQELDLIYHHPSLRGVEVPIPGVTVLEPFPDKVATPTAPPVKSATTSSNSRLDLVIAVRRAYIRRLKGLSAGAYCEQMEDKGYQTPERWQRWQCPKSYVAAFALKHPNLAIKKKFLAAVVNERKNASRPEAIQAWKARTPLQIKECRRIKPKV